MCVLVSLCVVLCNGVTRRRLLLGWLPELQQAGLKQMKPPCPIRLSQRQTYNRPNQPVDTSPIQS
jgi:hypothetical protein